MKQGVNKPLTLNFKGDNMAIIKSDLDNVIKAVNAVYNVPYYKEQFLKELSISDIDSENLSCKYQKWLIRKFSEGLE